MRFISRSEVWSRFEGKRVAVVGSGPGVLRNKPGYVDKFDVVVRVNNYKLSTSTGFRTDVFASFFGSSIRKSAEELKRDGVTLCMGKLPDADMTQHGLDAAWHRAHGQMIGLDYRPHYRRRKDWWFCDTYVPTVAEFLELFNALGRAQPTSGCAAINEVLQANPAAVYVTGFDFFASGIHNVNERWVRKNPDDPYRHRPDRELAWLKAQMTKLPITVDADLARIMNGKVAA